jgi:hypothetical protein
LVSRSAAAVRTITFSGPKAGMAFSHTSPHAPDPSYLSRTTRIRVKPMGGLVETNCTHTLISRWGTQAVIRKASLERQLTHW